MTTVAFTGEPTPPSERAHAAVGSGKSGRSELAAGVDSGAAVERYRQWVSDHRIAAAALAGFVGVHIATICGFFMPGVGLPKIDWNTVNGLLYTPTASPNIQFLSGSLFHYADGIVFGIMYALTLHPQLKRWRSTTIGNAVKGLAFGTILATISAAFMVPRVYYANAHVGFFSHNLGWKVVFAIYVWHWIYGLALGTVYNPRDDREPALDGGGVSP